MRTLTKELQSKITPDQAIELLKHGNERFVSNLKVNRNLLQQVNETSDGQHPFAVIISCMDSRTSSELVFDQGLGDIFSIRVAGNIINEDIIGSAEYACKAVGSKVILVLGHTACGAIHGTINGAQLGHLHFITSKIKRVLPKVETHSHDYANDVARANVRQGIEDLMNQSEILAEMVKSGEIKIVGGLYDVSSGQVDFFEAAEDKLWKQAVLKSNMEINA